MGYQVILFDLDGTLIDPKPGITRSVQYALERMGIPEENLDALTPFIGPPLIESFQLYYRMSEEQAVQAVHLYREYFSVSGLYENTVYQGIPELLQDLQKQDTRLILATSKPTLFAEKILSHIQLDQYFEAVVGSNLDLTRSSKTEIIGYILETYSVKPASCVMVGDRKHDIIGARNNQMDSIGVSYGYGSYAELEAAGATYIVEHIAALAALLQS